MSKKYICKNCEKQPDFDGSCPNCKPVSFICYICDESVTVPFAQVCNVCSEAEKPLCTACSSAITICDGCDYPVCKRHVDSLRIIRQQDANTYKADTLQFCSGFDDKNLCCRAFVRLKLLDAEYDNVFFDREWLMRDLPELYATRKWADRQKKTITKQKP